MLFCVVLGWTEHIEDTSRGHPGMFENQGTIRSLSITEQHVKKRKKNHGYSRARLCVLFVQAHIYIYLYLDSTE